jgi:hypothetical protein
MKNTIDKQQLEPRFGLLKTKYFLTVISFLFLSSGIAKSQQMPDVRGHVEEYPVNMVNYWQSRQSIKFR